MLKIDEELVQNLIRSQFPEWSDLPIRSVEKSGHDNRTFHLGNTMTVRLPSGKEYAPQVEKEWLWLRKLSSQLSIPISYPLAKGTSTDKYPFSWSVNKWIDGSITTHSNIKNLNKFAFDLATFLKEFQAIDATEGPLSGEHNFFRGGDLAIYNEETLSAFTRLKDVFPIKDLYKIWLMALQFKWNNKPVWVHGDFAVGNLLVKDGCLCGVIDFGMIGVGDPSCDYVIAWTFLDKESRKIFYDTLACDEDTLHRAKGWALWKALIVYDECNKNSDISLWSKHTIDEILNDCRN